MPVTLTFHKLPYERDDFLRAVLVSGGKVDLVTEYDQSAPNLDWCKDDTIGSFLVFTILLEGF